MFSDSLRDFYYMHPFPEDLVSGSLLGCRVERLLCLLLVLLLVVLVFGSRVGWGGAGCSKYFLPCRRAPGQSASGSVLLIENLCIYPPDSCPGFSPMENCLLF